jgi:hypothetical protein
VKGGDVAEAREELTRGGDSVQVQKRKEASAPVAAARAIHAVHLRIVECRLKIRGSVLVATRQIVCGIENVVAKADAVSVVFQEPDRSLNLLFRDGRCGGHECDDRPRTEGSERHGSEVYPGRPNRAS